jgi:antitoxin (DNA-binding transcriptional repressor) of toxin-antitoxin stability system
MSTVNIHEAKTQLSRLLEAAARGEKIIIEGREAHRQAGPDRETETQTRRPEGNLYPR